LIRALLALACLIAGPGVAQDLQSAVDRMEAAMVADPILTTCPADLYQTRQTLLGQLFATSDIDHDACRADPTACTTACLTDGSAEACLAFGLMLEIDDTPHLLPARHAHALACAMGEAAGCTNRAAGIRNVPLPGDALSLQPFDEKAPCLYRSFQAACGGDDSWGCAMLGQAQQYGEGTVADLALARAAYTRACDIAAPDFDFPACSFARDALARLTE
jgi:TPR repeat protein